MDNNTAEAVFDNFITLVACTETFCLGDGVASMDFPVVTSDDEFGQTFTARTGQWKVPVLVGTDVGKVHVIHDALTFVLENN